MAATVYDYLQVVLVEPCHNDRDGAWYRVTSCYRYGGNRTSELSLSLALRILPQWFRSLGVPDDRVNYAGAPIIVNCVSFAGAK